MRWHRLNILIDRLESKRAEFGYECHSDKCYNLLAAGVAHVCVGG